MIEKKKPLPVRENSRVVLIEAGQYNIQDIKTKLSDGLEHIGGIREFYKRGELLLLKPNLLVPAHPDRAVTTHPAFFAAVAQLFLDHGCKLYYGDSPAPGVGGMAVAAIRSGIHTEAKRLGIKPADFHHSVEEEYPDGLQHKKFSIARGIRETNGIISLPKMKTHGLMRITGAVKNQYGCLPGLQKGEFHLKMKSRRDLAGLFVDLTAFLKPRLYILDGIVAMEGAGPRSGDPKNMNVIILGTNPVAIDAVFSRLIDLKPEYVPTNTAGEEAGLGYWKEERIEIVGISIDDLRDPTFKVEREPVRELAYGKRLAILRNLVIRKPGIIKSKCISCGSCVSICPTEPKAMQFKNNKQNPPIVDYDLCIRCYCCFEICPESAISLQALLRKSMN